MEQAKKHETKEQETMSKVKVLKGSKTVETNEQDVQQTQAITNAMIEQEKVKFELRKIELAAEERLVQTSTELDKYKAELKHKEQMASKIISGVENVVIAAGIATVMSLKINMKKEVSLEKIRQGEV